MAADRQPRPGLAQLRQGWPGSLGLSHFHFLWLPGSGRQALGVLGVPGPLGVLGVPGPELLSEGRLEGGRREVTPSPRVLALAPPVVGPAVIVALTRLKYPVVVVETAAGTVAAAVAFCLTWPTGLLLDQKARAYFQPSQRFLVANLSSSLVAGLQGALDPDCASLHLTSCYQA